MLNSLRERAPDSLPSSRTRTKVQPLLVGALWQPYSRTMYPFLPADARVTTNPQPTCMVDDLRMALSEVEAERLVVLSPRLRGQLSLGAVADATRDEALILKLHAAGLVFDLPLRDGAVLTSRFCDYLYARVRGWRMNKRPEDWPWREVISGGLATEAYLKGIIIENYHYVRAATVRQSPLLSRASSPEVFDLVRDFVFDEGVHEHYFLRTLMQWKVTARQVQEAVPLAATNQFIALQHRLAQLSVLDYLAGSATLEVDPSVYARVGDPYARWETSVCCLGFRVWASVRCRSGHTDVRPAQSPSVSDPWIVNDIVVAAGRMPS